MRFLKSREISDYTDYDNDYTDWLLLEICVIFSRRFRKMAQSVTLNSFQGLMSL